MAGSVLAVWTRAERILQQFAGHGQNQRMQVVRLRADNDVKIVGKYFHIDRLFRYIQHIQRLNHNFIYL